MNYKQHPLSAAFPAMQADEFQALVDSIEVIGVQNPITLFEGMVLDGWHRYTAANQCGMDCAIIELGDIDPRDFVLAQNKARRNLTASQRAIAVTAVYEWHSVGANQHDKKREGTSTHPQKTNAELAAIAGVSDKTIKQAKKAQKAGFTEAIKDGAISVKEAAKIATGTVATPKPTPAIAPVIDATPDYTELDQAHEQISDLQAELVVARITSTDSEEQKQAAWLIAELRGQIKTLEATLSAVKISRDTLQNENAELRKQITRQRKEIDKATGKRTA
jgi:ParB-like chromosome segregation protein Spo0J